MDGIEGLTELIYWLTSNQN